MSIWKRVKLLEKQAKQASCSHRWRVIKLRIMYEHMCSTTPIQVSSVCDTCGKKKEKIGAGKELAGAALMLSDFINDTVRTDTGIKEKSKKTK